MRLQGKVIRIFDTNRLAINLGSKDGVERGLRFDVYSPGDEIIDPDTGEVLGNYHLNKTTVYAREVHERFTVARPPDRRERVQADGFTSLMQQFQYRTVPGDLPVEHHDLQPLTSGSTVRVGDFAVADIDEPDEQDESASEIQTETGGALTSGDTADDAASDTAE
jgi:hypothetical protein